MSYLNTLSQFATSPISIGLTVKAVGQWGGAQEYSLIFQMVIGGTHDAICWLVAGKGACDAMTLIG